MLIKKMFRTFLRSAFQTYVFQWLPDAEWKILSAVCVVEHFEAGQPVTWYCFLRRSSFRNFTTIETIPKQP